MLQDDLERRSAELTTLADAATILRQTWRSSALDGKPSIALIHSGVGAEVLLGFRHRVERGEYTVCIPWPVADRTQSYPGMPAELREVRDLMMRAAATICVLPQSPQTWWTAWIAGSLAALGKPAALLNLPDGGQRPADDATWWLRELPYVTFARSELVGDTAWIHASASAYVSVFEWVGGREPYVR